MVGATHGVNSGFVKYLGTGTSFNVSGVPGYQNFTIDNFIVGISKIPSGTGTKFQSNGGTEYSISSGATLSKSYNPTTGILKLSGTTLSTGVNQTGIGTLTVSLTCFAYLITEKIKK